MASKIPFEIFDHVKDVGSAGFMEIWIRTYSCRISPHVKPDILNFRIIVLGMMTLWADHLQI